MPRLTPIDPATAEGKAKVLLDGVQKKLGVVPNLFRTMAASPAVLESYLGFSQNLGGPTPANTAPRPTPRSARAWA